MTRVGFYLRGDVPDGGAGERFPFTGTIENRSGVLLIRTGMETYRAMRRRAIEIEGGAHLRLARALRPGGGASGVVFLASSVVWSEVRSRTEKPDTNH